MREEYAGCRVSLWGDDSRSSTFLALSRYFSARRGNTRIPYSWNVPLVPDYNSILHCHEVSDKVLCFGTSYTQTRVAGWGTGTTVPDTAASYTPPPTHFNRKPERKAYPRTKAHGGSKEREHEHGCARDSGIIHSTEGTYPAHNNVWRQKGEAKRARLCQPSGHDIIKRQWRGGERARLFQIPRHHTLHPRPTSIVNPRERPTRARQRVVAARRGSASTAVPETAASYTQPRGPDPRTTT